MGTALPHHRLRLHSMAAFLDRFRIKDYTENIGNQAEVKRQRTINMAPTPERKELRELNVRLKFKTEEMNRLKEEIKTLREQRATLKASLKSEVKTETTEG